MTNASNPRPADAVLLGGKITTGIPGAGDAEAIALRGDRVVAVGSTAEVKALVGPHTSVVELDGHRVIPGLMDSHVHVVRAGRSWNDEVRWGDVGSLAEGFALIRKALDDVPPTGCVVVVGGWHPGQFDEQRPPTPEELTELSATVPIFVQQQYDQAILNTAALKKCGIEDAEQIPFSGEVVRDASGDPTGIIKGQAAYAYCLELMMNQTLDRQIENTIAMQRDLNALGMTGAIDLGGASRMDAEAYRAVHEVHRRGAMTLRTRLFVHPRSGLDELDQIKDFINYLHPHFGDDFLRTVGIGEILFKGYYDGAGFTSIEISAELKQRLRDATVLLAETGWTMNIHAIHDSSVRSILDVWEDVDAEIPLSELRFSFSHADAISDESLHRAKALGVGIMVQDRMGMRTIDSAKAWGEDAVRHAPPLKTMLNLGLPIGGGTDATVAAPINPWRSLWWMVTGKPIDGGFTRDESERLTREEALAAYTVGSAWFSFDDDRLGTLEVGKLADLAVLSEDYFEVDDDRIPFITSVLTVVGGNPVHHSAEWGGAATWSSE